MTNRPWPAVSVNDVLDLATGPLTEDDARAILEAASSLSPWVQMAACMCMLDIIAGRTVRRSDYANIIEAEHDRRH